MWRRCIMNMKEILIISLLICVIFSISAVSAVDVDVNDTDDTILTAQEDTDVVAQSNDLSSYPLSNTNETVLGDDGAGSFTELNEAINGDPTLTEVTLTKDYKYNATSDSGLPYGIQINRNLIINGNGHIIDGDNAKNVFYLAGLRTPIDVTLNNITFVNAHYTGIVTSGAIYSFNNVNALEINDCNFINNSGNAYGGAIYAMNYNSLIINNSNFTNNSAAAAGGSIYTTARTGSTSITNCNFNDDVAEGVDSMMGEKIGDAGSIYVSAPNTVIDTVNINNAYAYAEGGAIFVSASCSNSRLTNVNITNSKVNRNGGAIMVRSMTSDVTLENIYLYNNTAMNGGAIYLASGTPMNHITAVNNTATSYGGALYLYARGSLGGNALSDSTFINNTANIDGGALYLAGSNGNLINVTFINNSASGDAGALRVQGTYWGVYNSTFTDNTAGTDEDTTGNGGAIMWDGHNGIIDNVTFTSNNATNRGGAVFIQNCDNVTIANSRFNDNFANINGGAVEFYKYALNGIIVNSTFNDNIANRSGGAVYWYGDTGEIINVSFTGNKALGNVMAPSSYGDNTTGGDGGAIMWTGQNGIVDNCTFTDNYASQRGGAVFLQGSVDGDCINTTFSSCDFISNEAGLNGGAIDWHECAHDGLVTMSNFRDNIAASNGGAIFWDGHNGRILHSNFTNNSANGLITDTHGNFGDGGAIIWSGINGTVDDCRFIDNNASQRGGGVFLQNCTHGNCTNTTFSHVYFENNYAGVNGGAIDWHKGAQNGHVKYGVFVNNTANRSGGAVFWFGTVGEISNSNFTGNKALGNVMYENSFGINTTGGHGGAIMWTGANGVIDNCTFDENRAKVNGGAIFMQGSTEGNCSNLIVSNGIFNDNFAGVNGGAVDWYKGAHDCVLENATFNNNIANRSGGAVFWYGEHGTIKNASFTNNQALGLVNASSSYGFNTTGGDGGAVMWTGSNGIVDGCNFTNNYAAARGGAIFLQGSVEGNCTNVTVSNSNFEQNKAETNGGAVNFFRGAVNGRILNSTFQSNEAITGIGGAVVWRGYNGTIDGATFDDNTAYAADAGAAYIEGDSCKLLNTVFDDNLAGDDGGAVYWTGNYGKIYNLTANRNQGISAGTSHSKGGTIIVTGSNMTIDLVEVRNGYAEVEGGGLFLTGNNVNITNVQFYDCTVNDVSSDNIGGALDIIGNNTRLINATIEGSDAMYGGAIDWAGNDGYACNIHVNNNRATEDGAALRIVGERFEIENSSFNDNEAGDDGGAIYWLGNDGIARNLTFYDNKGISSGDSSSNGGTMAIIGSNISIEDSSFKKTSAEIAGGAIFVTGNNVNITGSSFEDCSVSMDKVITGKDYTTGGGTIYILGNDTHIMNCTFDDAHGKEGGAVYVDGRNAVIDNATTSNSYALNGGAFYINGVNATISNSNISSSSVTQKGGAIYINGVNASVINSTFNNTYATSGTYGSDNLGGAIYIKGNYANIIGSEFEDAGAYQGGALYLDGNYANVTGSSVKGAYAYIDGGALYSTGSYSNIYYSNFTSNEARGDGGAMYWFGGKNSVNNTIIGCIFLENVAYANSNSNTRGGGAIYWSEGGYYGTIKDSQFINNSVQSSTKADGGAILWDKCHYALIDNCIFDGDYITTTNTGNVWIQGGAIYMRAYDPYTISNSKFINCYSEKEAGALYIQSNNNVREIFIVNTTFENNVAQAIGQNSNGGGAVQVKECDFAVFQNVTFRNNTANQGGAVTVLETRTNIQFINCTFDNNKATNGNGGSIWANKLFYIYNTTIANSTASDNGGGLYTIADMTYNNITFINNTATYGGGLYWNKANIKIQNMKFINNTGLERAGAIYITTNGVNIQNVSMTGNKAFVGSAIWADKDIDLIDVYLMENQANSSSLDIGFDEDSGEIEILFKGKDKYLNAVYLNGGCKLYCTNVTYWDESGEVNSGATRTQINSLTIQDIPEGGQNITVRVYGDSGILTEQYILTDNDGKVYLNLAEVLPGVDYHEVYVEAELNDDTYYTIIKSTTRSASEVTASANKTTYHSNSTIYANVTQGATGNVSVYLEDVFLGNITLDNSRGSMDISTLIGDRYLPAGNYTLSVVYNGNAKYDKSNTTAILEITKITPVILLNVTGIGYNLVVSAIVMDGEYEIADATGNVTIQVEDRTATIFLGNGQGMTIIYGLPIGNYTVNTTYNGDNNYYNATNSTLANVSEKTQTVLVLDVDSETIYYINETVPIKVTILPAGEGNVTLYINGVPHVLTLQTVGNSTFVEFNATELKDGTNYVFATYDGTSIFAPSWAEDTFNVIKYNATVVISTANITSVDTEVINITLPEDAEGILNITVNGTSYYVEIINGTATLPLSGLNVGVYNVTAVFSEDKKYYGAANSTLFNVTKATPTLNVTAANITVGENATVTVTLPSDVTGNVTIYVDGINKGTVNITNGVAVLNNIFGLKVGPHEVNVTYNGNAIYTSKDNNGTIFHVLPIDDWEIELTVEPGKYGENTTFTVKLPEGVTENVTLEIDGVNYTVVLTNGEGELKLSNLSAGPHTVTAYYPGDENYTNKSTTDDFRIDQATPTINIEVNSPVLVGDNATINVTVSGNATGNVTIYVDGQIFERTLTNGSVSLNVTGLASGNHNVVVFYKGDQNYTSNINSTSLRVIKNSSGMTIVASPESVVAGKNTTITVTMAGNETGNVIIEVNGVNYTAAIKDGVAVLNVTLPVGDYTAKAYYLENDKYNASTNTSNEFHVVDKTVAWVNITVDSIIEIDNNLTFTVTTNSNATLVVKVNGVEITPVDGVYSFNGTVAGNYTITAEVAENDYYTQASNSTVFTVIKHNSTVSITVGEVYEIESDFNITITNNTAVVVIINGKEYPVADGKVVIDTTELAAGHYIVTATIAENDKYYANSTTKEFNIIKHNATIESVVVPTVDVGLGKNATITVTMGNVTSGSLIIEVGGHNYTVAITDNVAVLNVTLPIGEYTAKAYYLGDDKYNPVNATSDEFTVKDKEMPIIIINAPEVVEVDNNITFTVTNSTPVNVTVNGVTVELKDGKYTYNATVAGTATIIVRSAETDDYYEGFNSTAVTVIKHNSTVSIDEVPNHFAGDEFNITITNNTSVVATINGKEYPVADGKVVVDTTKLPAGEYTVTATVYENDKYYGNSSTVSFNITKRASSVNITVDSQYYVGDIFNITIENNTAVNVTINGKSYLIDTNGNIIIDTSKLPAGEYIVSASVAENDKYFANATSKTFNIVKKASDLTIVAAPESVVVGKNTTITVTMANNETGSVIIEVNGVNYTVAITDHVAQLNVALPAGDYTAKAYYSGDDYYNASNNASNTFHVVDKTVAWVNITAPTSVEIDNNITFTVTTNSNATLVVKVNGVEITPVGGVYSFNGTVAGNYTITAEVAENDYYTAAENSTAFTVYKHASEIESVVVTPVTAVDGHNTTITVTMANAETGSVLIEVNGLNYTVPIKEGVATLTVTLPVGDYTAKVYYPGDDKYNDTNAQSDAFHVINKTVATVVITADNIIEIDNNLTFTVTTNSNATLVVKVNGVEVVKGADDKYRFNGTVAGNYTITAEVAENDYYTAAVNFTAFTVIKHNSTVAIDVGSVYEIESNFDIIITNNTAAVVTINGKEYAVVDGKVNVNTAELPAGHYIVTATIAENDKYYANSTTKEFDIIKHNATIESIAVPDVDVVVGKNATITVTMGNVTSGSVIIEVGGHNYTVPIVDKVAQLNVTLPVGTYTAKAYFTGDDKYNPVNATSAEFNVVNKTTATVIITADNIIEIDNNLTFTVTTNSNATLVVKVNGVEITPVDGVYSFNGTVAGNYTITAEVGENDYYTAASNSTMFTVIKHNSTVKVDEVPGHYVGDDFEITLTNNTAAVVTINGKEYAVKNGKVVIDTTALPAGEYTVTATVYENDKYYGNSSTVSFNITKRASSVNVTADPINVNETAVIDITGPSDFNGTAIVNVDGMNYSVALTNGVGQLRINGLANGTYDINVTYLENDNYLQSVNDTVKLLVNKVVDAEISASADNITVGDPAVIKVTVPEDATGNVTVTIGNITRTVPIAGGENEIIVPGVPVGDYDVKVTYNGDDKYLPANTTTPLSVKPAETDPADIKVVDQGNGTVVVVVPKDATGNVTITINGTNYTAPVVNGTATFDLTNETPGTYDITATYSGDENYTSAATNGTVTIPKHPTPMSIEVNATVVGNVTKVIVSVPENVTGNVTVEIDGKTYSVKPVDGKAVFEIEGLTAGNKTVVASYAGDDSYLANSTTAQFKVDKVASSVNVTGDVIKVDETATIVIEGPSDYNGTAVVTIDGKDYSVNVTNGAGQLKVDGLANGTYDVKVTLLENDKYLSSSNGTAKVLVNKVADAEITASADNITVGDPAVIKVTVPEDATGNVTVTIGNITRTVPITGGENEIIVPDVHVGEHEVQVTYNGDDKYMPANTTTSLTVKPAETSPDDIKVVDQGNGTVVITVPGKEGNVTVKIGDETYNATVVNGTAVVTLTNATPGVHEIDVAYSGDENHTGASTKANVTIPKYETPMSIEVVPGKVDETTTVTVNVPENATGEVTIEINGKTYSKEITDGKAVFEVDGLLSGNKTVAATYAGDDNYVLNSTTANFTVDKNPAPISVEVDNSTSGQATITVTLPDDATGYVIVNVDGVDYGINLTAGDKSVTIPIKSSGDYTAIVNYLGDEKYLGNSTQKDFHASSSKVPPNIAAEVENVPVGEDVQVKVTIPEGGDGNVTVTIGNITKTVSVTGGENIITIPGVSEGTHDVNISYSGNDQYEPQDITKSVTVFRSINAENITRGWNSPYDYKAEFLDKTGHVLENTEVQFIVNGKTYTVKTDSQGIAYLDTSKLDVGKYDVTIINPVTGEQTTRTTTIVKRLLENKDITMDFRDGTYYTVLAIGDDGKPVGEGEFVDIYVNTIHYSCRTDKDGYARLQINLNPKTYTVTAEYKLTKVSNKLVVKQTLKLVKKTVKVKKGKKLVLKAKLKWSNGKAIKGKKIVFKFKGKKYTAKTNSKGIAKVTIKKKVTKKLKKGKKYKYSATYVSNIVKGKVKVK